MSQENKEETKKTQTSRKTTRKKQPRKVKPYIHINMFLQTAVPMFNLSNMQVRGFLTYMNGRHYQYDEKVFLEELEKYLGKKLT